MAQKKISFNQYSNKITSNTKKKIINSYLQYKVNITAVEAVDIH